MKLDLPTLFIIFVLVDILLLSMFAFTGKGETRISNRYWSMSLLLHCLSMVLIFLRPHIPPFLGYVGAGTVLSASFVMMTFSISKLLNFKIPLVLCWIPVAIKFVGTSLVLENLPGVMVLTGFVFALQFSIMLYMLGDRWHSIHSQGRYFLAVSMFAIITVFYFRSAWVLTHEVTDGMILTGHIMISLAYLVGIIATIGLSGGMLVILRDRLGEQLLENEQFLNEIATNIPSIIYQFRIRPDGTSHFPYINKRVRSFGVNEIDLAHSAEKIFAKIHAEDYADVQNSIAESARMLKPWNSRFRLMTNNDQYRWHEAKSHPELKSDGSILWHGYMHDIQELRDIEEQIRHMAVHDGLTGLANRSLLESYVQTEIAHADRNQSGFCLMFLDLDNFKYINDRFGHGVGDKLLQEVAKRLNDTLRKSDFIARVGGDEFVILVRGMQQPESILGISERYVLPFPSPTMSTTG